MSIDVKFIFDSVRLGLSSSANILQIADVALRVVFLLFLPCFQLFFRLVLRASFEPISGVANGTSKNVGLRKFWQDLEISEAFLKSLEVLFFLGLLLLFLNLETFHQRVSGSDF